MTDLTTPEANVPTSPAAANARPVRQYGAFNALGLWTLYRREVGRFVKVATQTIFAPVLSVVLFMIVFKLAYPARVDIDLGNGTPVAFNNFIAPGLVMMAILNNSFQNSSSSLTIAKVQGSLVDFLMPPLSPVELTIGFVAGAATRGVICAILTAVVFHVTGLADMSVQHIWPLFYFGICAAICLGAVGAMGGIWADKFDHLAAVSQFVILPLTFLSGTFYLIDSLIEPFKSLSLGNPVFYFIDGFRYAFTGATDPDGNLAVGMAVSAGVAFASCLGVWWMIRTGYKIKS